MPLLGKAAAHDLQLCAGVIDGSICYFAVVAAVVFIAGAVDGDDDFNDVDDNEEDGCISLNNFYIS